MTIETVLTEKEVIAMKHSLGVIAPDEFFNKIARAIEQAVLQSPDVQRLRRIAQALDYKIEAYERYGAICEFEGEPMIHASNLEEMRDAAMEKQP